MSRKFIHALSGTYNVHQNEIARGLRQSSEDENSSPSAANQNLTGRLSNLSAFITGRSIVPVPETIKCVVHFLDDTEHLFEVDRSAKGEELMDAVFRHLELIEREYFALQFTEVFHNHRHNHPRLHYQNHHHNNGHQQPNSNCNKNELNNTTKQQHNYPRKNTTDDNVEEDQHRHIIANDCYASNSNNTIVYNKWLDPTKKIRKQMRFCQQPFMLHFRVKFYVTEISRLLEEYTRYHFYLQLRKDILAGRLCDPTSSSNDATIATLASYVLQSEMGDYCEEEHKPGYSNQFRFIPNQTDEFCRKVESLHRLHQGQTPADAELNYLEEAKHLELYGVDLHNAKDIEQQDIKIGVSSNGLTVYKNNYVRINMFSWAKIVKISFKRRYFFIQLKQEGTERYQNMIGFNLCSYRACKSLWKSCVEQHTFFRLHTPKPLTKKFFFFFSLGSKFRYSGKTEFQTIEESRKRLTRTERIFIRNNARNATMPASLINNSVDQKAAITDAQKHIVNLKLSSIVDVNNSDGITTASNGHHVNHHRYNRRYQLQNNRHQSPLSSMESTDGSLSSSSASSLLGHHVKSSIESKTSNMVASVTDKSNLGLSSKTLPTTKTKSLSNKKTVLSALSSSLPANSSSNVSSGQQERTDSLASHATVLKATRTESNTSTTSSSSLESSFMPLPTDDNDMTKRPNVHINEDNDLKKLSQTCDIIQNDSTIHDDGNLTIITIGTGPTPPKATEPIAKVCSIPSTFTAAYAPSSLISLPYIDSTSTASDNQTSMSTNNGIGDGSVTSQTPTITEDLPKETPHPKQFDFNSPIRELIKELYDGAVANDGSLENVPSDVDSPVHVVTVTMKPNKDNGPYGFNVKGGHDQNCPVLVSRVAPNSPADNAQPNKLHEGDQVLAINGVEVAGLKHEEVVQLIRSTKNLGPDAMLVLSIRPNIYYKRCDEHDECNVEEPFQYTSDDHYDETDERDNHIDESQSLLDASMNLLHEGLQSDLIFHFEFLPRRKEDEKITIARYIDNQPKNRYLDIAPYDSTRVVLKECNTGDYINASYVEMNIQASNVVNRYIATQGPLKRTTSDFWQMVWEQHSSLIVMVTPLTEDGRKKCYKYWPDEGQNMEVNDRLNLTQESCEDCGAFLKRRFKMVDPENNITHYTTHLQYLAWPDQGVPDDDTDFLKLIFKVREFRAEDPESPVIVHCSAGIGRTGVLILMETGICLIEANQPVYPLELVRIMRNQRAMLIQTSTQFRFVCEALYRVYRDRSVKPLEKYLTKEES